ncbi:MAG: gamma-glutamylcyclotransferase [Halieaceae bacterium]|uniref:gamma-glutamylcyclotransferase n=1 Tax=Haliea alexandrii TaxID=2448162 RepID=UPI001E36CBBF|nr:gamma-glutamylcyclotransferase [Haliea alexandrii]MCR9185299.1 gamma-glutamylcyclotransferase [Halieaceae bacterium]
MTTLTDANTVVQNRAMQYFASHERLWLFGYGSLIYKVDFPYLQRRPAGIRGWQRRFWQGSHDHRGTPTAPGRVVTLVASEGALCQGMAFEITPDVFEHLDHREKNGYLRVVVTLEFEEGPREEALVYIAGADNPAYLGPASEADIAAQISASVGPSGSNRDYLLQLAAALRALEAEDAHVFGLERALRKRE